MNGDPSPMLPNAVEVVDLSVLLSSDLPTTWPRHVPFAHTNWNWFADTDQVIGRTSAAGGPYSTHFIMIDEHCGTHMDAPSHFIPPEGSGLPWAGPLGAQSTEQIALDRLWAPALVVDVRELTGQGKPGVSPRIEPGHLLAWETEHGAIPEGHAVLFHTGWDQFYVTGPESTRFLEAPLVLGTEPGWPAPSPETMLLLHESGVRLVGIDAPSMGAVDDGAPVHWEGLSRGMLFVEMLTNLGSVPRTGGMFFFLPLKVEHGTGGPGRAVVVLPQGREE